ncbi:MAG: DAK2 domain-containing protein [Acidimicrobiales bacterium]
MPSSLAGALAAAAGALEGSAAELNRLDSYAGDGDLGVTMSEVARTVEEVVAAGEADGPAQLLAGCGVAVARAAPSTSGTLVATGLLRASKALPAGGAPVEALESAFAAAMEAIAARGKASVGDRTLLDGLDAVCASLRASAGEGSDWRRALRRAAGAASAAAEATADMVPKTGRASWAPERALGHPDAGCTMLALVLAAVAAAAGT